MNKQAKTQSFAILLIRVWLGIRAFISGIEKFSGKIASDSDVVIDGATNSYGLTASESVKTYGIAFYHGIPAALKEKFLNEPLLPNFLVNFFDVILGPALILFGITTVLGIIPRISLLALGFIFSILTVGLILIKQDAGVAWLGTHILLIAFALYNAEKDKYTLLGKNL